MGMGPKIGLIPVAVALALLGFALAGPVAHGAPSHQSGCHSQHTCPSDHHTYVWTDPSYGSSSDCAEPGASEYDPSRDATTIVWDGLTYYCRSAAGRTICRAHAVSLRLNLRGISPARIKRPEQGPKTSAHLDGCPVFALTWEPAVAKRQNVVRHRQSNDIRLDPFAAKR